MKTCAKCGKIKPLSQFSKHKKQKDGHQVWCKPCTAENYKIWYQETGRDQFIFKRYGVTPEQFEELRAAQNNQCAICELPFVPTKVPFVDHDHVTGKVRSLLCTHCNSGLGHFKDSIKIMQSAQEYIKKYSG